MLADIGIPRGVVGICGPKESEEALLDVLEGAPPSAGLAFVVVHHAQSGEWTLTEATRSRTSLPVVEISDGTNLQANHIYLAPPGMGVVVDALSFRASESDSRSLRRVGDGLFRSLALEWGERAYGILLAGSGSDGLLGLQAIRECDGITIVQNSQGAAEGSSFQRALIGDYADRSLPPEEMGPFLLEIATSRGEETQENGLESGDAKLEYHLGEVTGLIKQTVGHDFSLYKRNMILRRIYRRLLVNGLDSLHAYLSLLRRDSGEVRSLFRELLISVTGFFRDPEAYEALKIQIRARLLPRADERIRVWVPACATGEEVYSLAILILEELEEHKLELPIQIFASDIDEAALRTARAGSYPEGISNYVSPERLERFFTFQGDHYQIKKELRAHCLFSRHNVASDPPFSRIDLVSCRNLMIYLDTALQSKVVRALHYGLRPGGLLFLGQAESLADHPNLFRALNKSQRVFCALKVRGEDAPFMPFARSVPRGFENLFEPRLTSRRRPLPRSGSLPYSIFQHLETTVVVFDEANQILEVHGDPDRFFAMRAGPPNADLLVMAREEIRVYVRTAVHTCRKEGKPSKTNLRLDTAGKTLQYELLVIPGQTGRDHAPEVWFAAFRAIHETKESQEPNVANLGTDPVVTQLESELESTRQHLQSTVEELEASNEELRSTNEELLSMNEELQSSNEEVETANEEFQSVNEELETVNFELQQKISELGRAHTDLRNLFENTPSPTIFVDRRLQVQQFTPAATEVFRLIASDIGRPLTDIAFLLQGVDLERAVRRVLGSGVAEEFALTTSQGLNRHYSLRISPYRSLRERVDGAVLAFFETTTIEEFRVHAHLLAERRRELAHLGVTALQGEPIAPLISTALSSLVNLDVADFSVFLEPTGRDSLVSFSDCCGWTGNESPPELVDTNSCHFLRGLATATEPCTAELANLSEQSGSICPETMNVVLGIRLASQDETYGYLLAFKVKGGFAKDDREFMQSLSNVLFNALLRDEETRLTLLKKEVFNHLASHSELEKAVPFLLTAFALHLPIDICELWQPAASGELECRHFLAPNQPLQESQLKQFFDDLTFNPGESFVGRVFETGKVDWSPNLEDETAFHRSEEAIKLGLRTAVGLPLLQGERCAGVLALFSRGWLRRTPRSEHTLTTISLALGEFERRAEAEAALREREANLFQALRRAPFPLFVMNEEGRFLVVSAVVSRLTGFNHEQLFDLESWVRNLYPPAEFEERSARLRGFLSLTHSHSESLHEVLTSTGEKRLWELYVAPLGKDDRGHRTVVCMAYDTTARERHKREQEEVSRRKDQFLATLGHELRNPLAAICNSAALLRMPGGDGDDSKQWVEVIHRQSRQMTKLLDGLLDLARISRGQIKISPVPVDIVAATSHSVEAFSCTQEQTIEANFPNHSVWVLLDSTRWSQVVDNILNNAVKFTPGDGNISVELTAEDETCTVRISDDGHGIEPDQIERMFEPFHQEDDSVSPTGMGLGLPLVAHLVEQHGGQIQLHSDGKGKGATVTITLPICSAPSVPDPADSPTSLRVWNVLLVEDEEDVLRSQAELLQQMGHSVRTASTAEKAIEQFRANRPEIVFCDLNMHGELKGFELIKSFKRSDPSVPVLAVTGFGMREDEQRCLRAGFEGHLSKPLTQERISKAFDALHSWHLARGMRVLLVDDNKFVLATMEATLRRIGVEVNTSLGGTDVFALAAETKPQLIVLDLSLGRGRASGFDLARQLRELPELSDSHFVALTGSDDPALRKKAGCLGFTDYLVKPLSLKGFLGLVRRLAN